MPPMTPNPDPSSSFAIDPAARLHELLDRAAEVRWLPGLILVLALLLLADSAARWTWALFSPVAPVGLRALPASASSPAARFDVTEIQAADLFGAPPLTGNLNAIPISSLNLVLTGVVVAGNQSYALIEANGQPQKPFSLHSEVLPGARLVAVYPDRVLIRRAGRVESLLLKQPDVDIGGGEPAPGVAPAIPLPPIHRLTPGNYLVPPALMRQEVAHPQPLLTQAVMVPYEAGGFLIRSIAPGSLYQKLGLKAGDVIRAVNGQPLDSLKQAMQAYQKLPTMTQIDLQILRNGQVEDLHYRVQ